MDVEALNSQVEERKLQEATEQSKKAAYGKSPRAEANQGGKQGPEWVKGGQFCLRVGPEA